MQNGGGYLLVSSSLYSMCHSSSTPEPEPPAAAAPLAPVLSGEEIMGAATGTNGCISPAVTRAPINNNN